jgi:hypothetical protein
MNIKEMEFESVDITPVGSQTPIVEFAAAAAAAAAAGMQ